MRTLLVALFAFALGFGAATPNIVLATHSVPSPQVWWDHDDDRIKDATDGEPGYVKTGSGWAPDQFGNDYGARFAEAIAVWKNGTRYDPKVVGSGVNNVFVDGSSCGAGFDPTDYGVNVTRAFNRGTFFDLFESDICLNTMDWLFYRQAGSTPPQCSGCPSARGVFVHELGHGVFLNDLQGSGNCPPGPTMCNQVSAFSGTQAQYSLATDDINAANLVYPQ